MMNKYHMKIIITVIIMISGLIISINILGYYSGLNILLLYLPAMLVAMFVSTSQRKVYMIMFILVLCLYILLSAICIAEPIIEV